ncbi:hypothetical protein LINPERPRIM_LOCUS6568 [Linum perenne]
MTKFAKDKTKKNTKRNYYSSFLSHPEVPFPAKRFPRLPVLTSPANPSTSPFSSRKGPRLSSSYPILVTYFSSPKFHLKFFASYFRRRLARELPIWRELGLVQAYS